MAESGRTPVERLMDLLEPQRLKDDVFRAWTGDGEGRLFGGLVAAQAVVAAGRTIAERHLHSLHAYFLRPGRQGLAVRLVVDRIREGRTFATRRVVVEQSGAAILNLSASFTRTESGISHQSPMPEAPGPEGLPDWEDMRARILGDPEQRRPEQPVEIRACDPDGEEPTPLPGRRSVWMRPRGPVPEDPLLNAALLVYASDRTLVGTIARPHGLTWGRRVAASLDHAVWLHRPARFDHWVLYVTESPAAHAARGIVFGAMYQRDGTRIASVAQEGIVRVPRREP